MFAKHVLVVLLPFYIAAVNAANDWSKPCTSGVCEWDTKDNNTSGNIIVTAATSALSDITPAAGWHILDCDPKSLEPQTIRLVCESEDAKDAGCDALNEGGAENTVVRLPNSCAQGPFARLVRIWDSEDQNIPDEARRKFRKRTVAAPGTVQNAIIDFDFAAVPPKNDVEMLATGSNNPAAPIHEQAARIRRAHGSQKMRRGVTGRAPTDSIATFLNKLGELNKAGVSTSGSSPITFKKNIPIAKNTKTCPATGTSPALTGTFDMNVDVNIDARVSYGFAVEGKIIPPTINNVGFFTDLSGNASALFHIVASAEASLDSGRIDAGNIPLSPLSFPGVVTVGPALQLGVSGKATLGLTGKMDVGTTFDLATVEVRFPPKQGPSNAKAISVKAPLKLEVTPQADVGGSLEGHIIPRLALGVNLLNGFSKANVFVDLDMSGTVTMGIKAAAAAKAGTGVKPSASGSFSGCVEVNSEISANAGVDGAVPGLFDKTTAIPIFKKPFELFKASSCMYPSPTKCFGEPAPAKRPAFLDPGKAKPVVGASNSTASGSPGSKSGLKDAAKIGAKLGATTGAATGTTAPKPAAKPAASAPAKPAAAPPAAAPPAAKPPAKPAAAPPAAVKPPAKPAAAPPAAVKPPAKPAAKPGKTTRSLESPIIDKRAGLPTLKCPGIVSAALTTIVRQ